MQPTQEPRTPPGEPLRRARSAWPGLEEGRPGGDVREPERYCSEAQVMLENPMEDPQKFDLVYAPGCAGSFWAVDWS